MKRRKFNYFIWCLRLLLVTVIVSCDTADSIETPDRYYFVKYYGTDGNQVAVDLAVLPDGTFMVLGNSTFGGTPGVVLLRIDAKGGVMWEMEIATGATGVDIEPLASGDYVVLVNVSNGCKLFRVSSDGSVLGESGIMTDGGRVTGKSVTPLTNGGYMISGISDNTASARDRGNLVNFKLNPDFGIQQNWSPVNHGFGVAPGSQSDGLLDVAVKTFQRLVPNAIEPDRPDTIYHVFGYTNSNIGGNNPDERAGLFYFKRDELGGTADVYFPGNLQGTETDIQSVERLPEILGGGYLALGTATRASESYLFVARLREQLEFRESDLTLYMHIPLGRPVQAVSATTSLVGERGFFLLANEVRATGATNMWLTKIDQSGAVRWSASYGSENENDRAAAVVELPDGKIVILGTVGLADNQTKIALIKTNAQGQFLR